MCQEEKNPDTNPTNKLYWTAEYYVIPCPQASCTCIVFK